MISGRASSNRSAPRLTTTHTVLRTQHDPAVVDGQPKPPHLAQKRLPALTGNLTPLPVQHADPAMSGPDQMSKALLHTGGNVDTDSPEPGLLRPALQQHQRHTAQPPGEHVVLVLEVPHNGIGLMGQHIKRLPLPGLIGTGVPHHHLPPTQLGGFQHPGGHLGKERIHQVRNHQTHRHGSLPHQPPREPAGPVVQRPSGLKHPLLGPGIDLTLVIDSP
ncbi:hypothetical protein QFZ24_007321 [Streptomyces phaeochromogenes]|nr:hypothetical protein [Streptomyces phaeochromogenes]